ncbi:MAG: methyl-accepting chemotaxis protein [Burkholderia contaminans]|uniref:Methyl-accepting chemotaxis protein n=2 Tax=Pseudomonadota TaxID=1224 RepID=A0AAP4QY24_9BURK|nr:MULTISPECIES: methyl-accepting chemotaxis protein [Burkholderia]MBD1414948.1 Tar ligand binding domain-containing protein [Burkholderia contaminans]MBH9667560.1 Tar ligand binding domain-containing protein [Burkholderia contaminans]MBH9674922.1 Tar ligand binding domain-containing protein [Burkholderia contaminans]MBH9705074.1 Tar ligand binding domain-containing protein [Burkholderia contaminans]MBH9722021.1 Tar ligand binding domain-containing protein [Burkholderia contaminans]
MVFKNLTIRARIGLTMAFLAVLLGVIGGLGLYGMTRANETTRDIFTNQMPSAVDVSVAEIFAARERLSLDRAALLAGTPDAADAVARSRAMRTQSDAWWQKYLALPRGPEEDRLAQDVAAKRLALQRACDAFASVVGANQVDQFGNGAKQLQASYSDLSTASEALRNFQFTDAQAGFDHAESTYDTLRVLAIAALLAGLAAAVVSWLTLSRAIGRPIADALAHFDAIAAGDLRRPIVVDRRDEMGQLLEGLGKMQRGLVETVRTVRGGSESIATAARQIAAGNIDLSSRTEEQAAALQETASSMEQLTGTVKQNADNARQASSLAANASEIANKGNMVVGQVVGTMGEINDSSAKIADIIAIIEGIAFQTNILALNAAVEAARAGEEGRGFAVVAGEVRSLAQRSSTAAKEIKVLIDASVERIRSGSSLVDEAGRTMSDVIGAVQRVTDIMGEIAAASEEQSGGIDQVARAVAQMDEVTQQNAALVEEAAAAAQSLDEQAGRLRETAAVFQLNEDTARPGVSAPAAVRHAPRAAAATVAAPVQAAARDDRDAPPKRVSAAAPARKPVAASAAPAQTAASATADDWETF